jgi:hypothetical protein
MVLLMLNAVCRMLFQILKLECAKQARLLALEPNALIHAYVYKADA